MSEPLPYLLHVVVVPDGGGWFARSLEWDYSACADNTLELRKNFRKGLELTVAEHFKRFGKPVFDRTPENEWAELCAAPGNRMLIMLTSFLLEM